MKKLLILLFSMLVSLSSYGETYVCATNCFEASMKVEDYCQNMIQLVYERKGGKFVAENEHGEIVEYEHIAENERFLTMVRAGTASILGFTWTAIINKDTLEFTDFQGSLGNTYDAKGNPNDTFFYNHNRQGNCIVLD